MIKVRKFAQIHIDIWNNTDFRELTPAAQHLYFALISHPTLSYCGVGDWRPKRIAAMAHGWDASDVEQAGSELEEKLFILIDQDTDEVLVRSFLRNSQIMRQPKLGVSAARAFSVVASEGLRGVVVFEMQRLRSEHSGWSSWQSEEVQSVLGKEPIDPSVYPKRCPTFLQSVTQPLTQSVRGPVTQPLTQTAAQALPNQVGNQLGDRNNSNSNYNGNYPYKTEEKTRGEGVKGGPGGEGEGSDESAATQTNSDATPPTPKSLDELAALHSAGQPTRKRGTCATHPNGNPNDVPCHGCATARREREQDQAKEEEQRIKQRRAAIDACDWCDDNGIILTPAGATRCTHQEKTTA